RQSDPGALDVRLRVVVDPVASETRPDTALLDLHVQREVMPEHDLQRRETVNSPVQDPVRTVRVDREAEVVTGDRSNGEGAGVVRRLEVPRLHLVPDQTLILGRRNVRAGLADRSP